MITKLRNDVLRAFGMMHYEILANTYTDIAHISVPYHPPTYLGYIH